MILLIGPILILLLIAARDVAKEEKWWWRIPVAAACVIGIILVILAYADNQEMSRKLNKIDDVENTVDSLKDITDTLLIQNTNIERSTDSLLKLKEDLTSQISSLSEQHDRLLSTNDSLIQIANIQLEGTIESQNGASVKTESGDYERIDKYRSKWPQDLQDISISLDFDLNYERIQITQKSSSGLLIVTCKSVDTVITSTNLEYVCDYLAKSNWIEIRTYSKKPINLIRQLTKP